MLNITNHQGNTNQNHSEISPHTFQNVYCKKTTDKKRWRGSREEETLLHCWRECKLVQPLWKTAWRFLNKLKIFIITKTWKQHLRLHQWRIKMIFIYVYICMCVCIYIYMHIYTYTSNIILFSHTEEWNFLICNSMNGLRGHYAKWKQVRPCHKELDRSEQLTFSQKGKYYITYMWNLKNTAN